MEEKEAIQKLKSLKEYKLEVYGTCGYSIAIDVILKEFDKLKQQNKELQEENKDLKADLEMYENGVYFSGQVSELQDRIDKAIRFIEIQIEIIKQQPSKDKELDNYFIERLNGFLSILDKKEE